MSQLRRKPVVGLALGSGSARGWSHFGVLHALRDAGVTPDIICGTSIGALVGATYAAGQMDAFESWVLGLGRRKVFGFMDFNLGGGLLKGEKIIEFWRANFAQEQIGQLALPFGCVATDLHTGAEVWLRQGAIAESVRASIALPGLFTPVLHEGRLLVDGGLVNPVPVSLARAMGADIVIAVDLNTDMMRRHLPPPAVSTPAPAATAADASAAQGWGHALRRGVNGVMSLPSALLQGRALNETQEAHEVNESNEAADDSEASRVQEAGAPAMPSLANILLSSVNIMQMRIARSRLAGDPAEILITPRLSHIGLLEFHRGQEAIDEGYAAAQARQPALKDWGL